MPTSFQVEEEEDDDEEDDDDTEVSQWSIAAYPIGSSNFLYQRCKPSAARFGLQEVLYTNWTRQ